MQNKLVLENVKGTRDTHPEEMLIKEEIINKINKIFKSYGFVPLATPALEKYELLASKSAGGSDIDKETYNFEISGRKLALKYDQTVPLSRYIGMNSHLTLPFKRYQYDRSWRYGDIGPGRYREFYQFDIDIVGSSSMIAEAEILSAIVDVMKELGIKGFKIRVSNRKLLDEIVLKTGIKKINNKDIFRAIDKLEKIGEECVINELEKIGLTKTISKEILKYINLRGKPEKVLVELEKNFKETKGYAELKELADYAEHFGIIKYLDYDISIARGLDYYTGPVFETNVEELNLGSICSGGRYDNMIGMFSGKAIPATGISLGIDRIIDTMKRLNLIKERKTATQIMVCTVKNELLKESIKISKELRENGFNVEVDLMNKSLKNQIKYADKQCIQKIIIIGEKELAENKITIRNLETSKEKTVLKQKLLEELRI
ncbi:MAG: histidine--tRNA ligase [Nanoarchaeota archaeon]|nr:histidine--tRNA ligase [Nanoarchaeota archaeon]